jgi:hypothetical protein
MFYEQIFVRLKNGVHIIKIYIYNFIIEQKRDIEFTNSIRTTPHLRTGRAGPSLRYILELLNC